MRIVVRLVFGVVAGLLLLVFNLETGNAQVPPSVGLKPSSGPAGSSFTISWNGFSTCRIINFFWDSAPLTSQVAPGASGSIGAKVPSDAKPGTYPVTATCASQKETA